MTDWIKNLIINTNRKAIERHCNDMVKGKTIESVELLFANCSAIHFSDGTRLEMSYEPFESCMSLDYFDEDNFLIDEESV